MRINLAVTYIYLPERIMKLTDVVTLSFIHIGKINETYVRVINLKKKEVKFTLLTNDVLTYVSLLIL